MSENVKWTDEQQSILNHNDGNLLVSASAGSGKTSVMVEKIVQKLLNNVPLEKILVVSYTVASSQDMRKKIIEKLYKRVQNNDCTPEQFEFLRSQIDDISFADIGTIDSFCAKLVREYFDKLNENVSPVFVQMEEQEALEMKNRVVQNVIYENFEKGDADFLEVSSKISQIVNNESLSNIILKLYDALSINPNPQQFIELIKSSTSDDKDGFFGKQILNYYKKQAKLILPYCKKALLDCNFLSARGYSDGRDAIINTLQIVADAESYKDLVFPIIPRANGKVSEYDKQVYQNVKKQVKKILDGLNNNLLIDTTGYDIAGVDKFIAVILRLVKEFYEQYKNEKLINNKLDFNDLSQLVKSLVDSNNQKLLDNIAGKYDCVFVDEYQDINPMQEYILNKISNNNVFMVGDIKQSIYAFRNADANIFKYKKQLFNSDNTKGIAKNMTVNFRSTKKILEFCNKVFSAIMKENQGGVNYGEESKFLPCESTEDGVDVCVKLYYCANEDDNNVEIDDVYSVKNHYKNNTQKYSKSYLEGLATAHQINDIVKRRNYEYKDIAILFSTRNAGKDYIKALMDNGIPIISDGFFKNVGIKYKKQLINILNVLNNAQNDINFVGFMLSYFGGFTENEVAKIRLNHKNLSIYDGVKQEAISGEFSDKCQKLLSFISKWRDYQSYNTVDRLLSQIILETGFEQYIISDSQDGESLFAVDVFLNDIAKSSCKDNLSSYLSYCENAQNKDDGLPPYEAQNAVTISTIHGSKGLEYDVVFIASIDKESKGGDTSDMLFHKDLGVGMKLYNETTRKKIKSLSYNSIYLLSKENEIEEKIRLMYVAFTRAKKELYITGSIKAKGDLDEKSFIPKSIYDANNFLDLLYNAVFVDSTIKKYITEEDLSQYLLVDNQDVIYSKAVFNTPDENYVDEIKKVVLYDYPYEASTSISNKYTVSEINKQTSEFDYSISAVHDLSGQTKDNRRRGIAYHTIMENIDFSLTSLSEVNLFIDDLVEKGLITKDDADLVDGRQIFNLISSPIIKNGIKERYLREQPFMLKIEASKILDTMSNDRVLVQGVCDLIILGKENTIIDFKYSVLSDDDLVKKYKKQLELYKMATERALNVKIAKTMLYSFKTNHFILIN